MSFCTEAREKTKMMMLRRATRASRSPAYGARILTLPPPFLSSLSHYRFRSNTKSLRFKTLDEGLSCFNRMIRMHTPPSIVHFAKLLNSISRMKHHSVVVSPFPF